MKNKGYKKEIISGYHNESIVRKIYIKNFNWFKGCFYGK